MKKRTDRLVAIKRMINTYSISSQDELLEKLADLGYKFTQATLSRDLKFLKVGKIANEKGEYIYVLPEMQVLKEDRNVDNKVPISGFRSLEFSNNFAVMRTQPGFASGIALAIDNMNAYEILGTIAGDDTILIIPREDVSKADVRNILTMVIPEIEK